MILDNKTILSRYNDTDRVRYYHWCVDLSLAGEDYKVNEILYFAGDASDPLVDFIQVKKYDDGFLLLLIYTEDTSLIGECMEYVDTVKNSFQEIEVRTPYASVLEMDRLCRHFSFGTPEYPASPVYYIHSPDALRPLPDRDTVSISLLQERDKAEIAQCVEEGKLDPAYMNADVFVPCPIFKDVKWYILRVDGEIAGYLRGECGYANIYDIGWLYVEPRFRGHGYAADLVMYFSKDLFAGGAIPHYGYAISEASVRVAEKCGYVCDRIKLECRSMKPLQPSQIENAFVCK